MKKKIENKTIKTIINKNIENNNIKELKNLIKNPLFKPDYKYLNKAIQINNLEIVKLFVEDTKINPYKYYANNSLVEKAIELERKEILLYFLQQNNLDHSKFPFNFCFKKGYFEFIEFLLKEKRNIFSTPIFNNCINFSCLYNNEKLLKLLLQEITEDELEISISNISNLNIFKIIYNFCEKKCHTFDTLKFFCVNNNYEITKFLLNQGHIDPTINNNNLLCFVYNFFKPDNKIIELLINDDRILTLLIRNPILKRYICENRNYFNNIYSSIDMSKYVNKTIENNVKNIKNIFSNKLPIELIYEVITNLYEEYLFIVYFNEIFSKKT